MKICVNFERTFQESTFDNNCNSFPVWVPATVDASVKTYASFFDGGDESIKRCQDLYDRTQGRHKMPIGTACVLLLVARASSALRFPASPHNVRTLPPYLILASVRRPVQGHAISTTKPARSQAAEPTSAYRRRSAQSATAEQPTTSAAAASALTATTCIAATWG